MVRAGGNNKLATKGLLGMSKPHMLGAQNDNIKQMLGMVAPESIEPKDKTAFSKFVQKGTPVMEKSKGSKIDSGLGTPQDMQRKKAPLGRPISLVNKSVSGATSSVFKPGDS